jgi:hypothetical protein
MISGIMFFTAAGDPDKIKKSKDLIKTVAIGLFLVFLSWSIVVVLYNAFGAERPFSLGDWYDACGIKKEYVLNIDVKGEGTTFPAKSTSTNRHIYPDDEIVTITAEERYLGWDFIEWEGDCKETEGKTCSILMDGPKGVTAVFGEMKTLTINVTPSGGGSVTLDNETSTAGEYRFLKGSSVNIAPKHNTEYEFSGWGGACEGTDPNDVCTVTMNNDKSVTVNFIKQWELTIAVNGGGTTSPAPKKYFYSEGSEIDIIATPNSGYIFTHWSGACDGTDPNNCSVTMDDDKSVTAVFRSIDLIVTIDGGTNSGKVRIDERLVGAGSYPKEGSVTIEAVPSSGYRFDKWTGDCSGENSICYLDMNNEDKNVTASFQREQKLTINITGSGTTSPGSGDHFYGHGDSVIISIPPAHQHRFLSWSGHCSEADSSCTLTMDGNKDITANFMEDCSNVPRGGSCGGGTVVDDNKDPDNDILIVATKDYGGDNKYTWWSSDCGWEEVLPTGSATSLTDGAKNTTQIIKYQEDYCDHGSAAKKCRGYDGGGYTDWYLPSLKELSHIHKDRDDDKFKFTAYCYWSSTQLRDDLQLWAYAEVLTTIFGSGSFERTRNKTLVSCHIRCVRRHPW